MSKYKLFFLEGTLEYVLKELEFLCDKGYIIVYKDAVNISDYNIIVTELFTEIIEPLGHKAKEKNDVFIESYSQMINKFTKEFANIFCKDNGEIDWDKLVRFNSAKEEPQKRK